MKKLLALMLALCMILLCACGGKEDATEDPVDQETNQQDTDQQQSDPTPPPVVYRNPLNGEEIDAPYEGRVFAVTIDNSNGALPQRGVSQADIYVELYINDYATRGLAIFSDISKMESVGPIRSIRYNFTDLGLAYNMIVVHASGSQVVRDDVKASGLENIYATGWAGYRDEVRYNNGYPWEHTLFVKGETAIEAAIADGYSVTAPGKEYGLQFTEDGTPTDGVVANTVSIDYTLYGYVKNSTVKYDAATGKYNYWQYGEEMVDENTNQPEAFRNVIVMLATVENDIDDYHVADLYGTGTGYFACGGKMIPILWSHEGEHDPIYFTKTDGTPLELGVGSTYLAIAPKESPVTAS